MDCYTNFSLSFEKKRNVKYSNWRNNLEKTVFKIGLKNIFKLLNCLCFYFCDLSRVRSKHGLIQHCVKKFSLRQEPF